MLDHRTTTENRSLGASGGREYSPLRKIGTFLLLALFCFQLSRFYLVAPGCWHGRSDGYSLQHCKDAPDGLGLNQVQPVVLSTVFSQQAATITGVHVLRRAELLVDTPHSTPFHPPRSLS